MSLTVKNLSHTYKSNTSSDLPVLHEIDFELHSGDQLLLRGISGSGKTTLINILAGLLTPTSGEVTLNGQSMYALSEVERDHFRRRNIGYVFQTHHLVPVLNAWENVAMPLALSGQAVGPRKKRALTLLDEVGLKEFATQRPFQLSNGQRQRVAIARALAGDPTLVLADEPTASLDGQSARNVTHLLRETCRNNNAMLLVASHDPMLSEQIGQIVDLEYGRWHPVAPKSGP